MIITTNSHYLTAIHFVFQRLENIFFLAQEGKG